MCTHSRREHRKALLSVPLTHREPLYPVPSGGIATVYPNSTYDYDDCWCGCTIYTLNEQA